MIVNKIWKQLRERHRFLRVAAAWGLETAVLMAWHERRRTSEYSVTPYGFISPIYMRGGSSDAGTFVQIFDWLEYALPTELLEVKWIVDGGANIGLASVDFARRFPDAEITALEPDGENFKMAVKNTEAYPKVKVHQAALWPDEIMLETENPEDEKWALRFRPATQSAHHISTLTLPGLIHARQGAVIDILKLDIEGAELEIFSASDLTWLKKVRVLMIELHEGLRPGCGVVLHRAFEGYRTTCYEQGEKLIVVNHSCEGAGG
jgi:FkbM family methyltransferase